MTMRGPFGWFRDWWKGKPASTSIGPADSSGLIRVSVSLPRRPWLARACLAVGEFCAQYWQWLIVAVLTFIGTVVAILSYTAQK
jgi:hypothetical protein